MKTLYLSDLDGTLLGSGARLSPFTAAAIGDLVARGMLFSYATARSYQTARRVTAGLEARIPLIVYNGAMVVESTDGSFLLQNFFAPGGEPPTEELLSGDVYPIVYAFVDGKETCSFLWERCSDEAKRFLDTRAGDPRLRPVSRETELLQGEVFYLSCIDRPQKLLPFYTRYRERFPCLFQQDLYTGDTWLEILPPGASKANAARQLKALLGCRRLVAFGDGLNDLDLFALADEAYAVENAVPELKAAATGVIGRNDADSVARWLQSHWQG